MKLFWFQSLVYQSLKEWQCCHIFSHSKDHKIFLFQRTKVGADNCFKLIYVFFQITYIRGIEKHSNDSNFRCIFHYLVYKNIFFTKTMTKNFALLDHFCNASGNYTTIDLILKIINIKNPQNDNVQFYLKMKSLANHCIT